jgi:hypothetical protein
VQLQSFDLGSVVGCRSLKKRCRLTEKLSQHLLVKSVHVMYIAMHTSTTEHVPLGKYLPQGAGKKNGSDQSVEVSVGENRSQIREQSTFP